MQQSFADLEYAAKKRLTRRDRFLGELEILVPWAALCAEIEPFYPKTGQRGRQLIGLERMLRMCLAQQCFGMSDEGIEDALYDSQAIRGFVSIAQARGSAPDANRRCADNAYSFVESATGNLISEPFFLHWPIRRRSRSGGRPVKVRPDPLILCVESQIEAGDTGVQPC